MSQVTPTITRAGLAAIWRASNDGFDAQITDISIGVAAYDPDEDQTELKQEIGRWKIIDSLKVSESQISLYSRIVNDGISNASLLDNKGGFWVSEIGFHLSDGTLFAVHSVGEGNPPSAYKSKSVDLDVDYQIVIEVVPTDNITVINTKQRYNEGYHHLQEGLKQAHILGTDNAKSILELQQQVGNTASAKEFGIVAAYQSMSQQRFMQDTYQAGFHSARQYNYSGDSDGIDRHVWDRGYNPMGSHNHPNYDRMSGNAEVSAITPNGEIIYMRHSDYRHKQSVAGDFLATKDVALPEVPSSVKNAGSLDAQVTAMRELYKQYQDGKFPEGFKWVLTYLETWVEPFTGDASETFDSFRHQNLVNKAVDQYRLNKVYHETGLKDRFENLPLNKVFVAGLTNDGKPQLGILKGRFVCKDLSELGDLRPWIDTVDDPVMDVYRDINDERFRVRGELNKPSKLDEIMACCFGLDGEGAYLTERHQRGSYQTEVRQWGTGEPLNAAQYHRWGSTVEAGASGRRNYKAGYNISNFWKALNTQEKVLPTIFDNMTYRVSHAMPYELILYHPAMDWNPLNLTINSNESYNASKGTSSNPYNGVNPSKGVWYRTPDAFYTANSISDIADTGGGVKWVRGANNVAHPMRASGIYINLPNIEGVGTIRQRYPIYQRPHDGTYETALAHAYHKRSLKMYDELLAQVTLGMCDEIKRMGDKV